MTRVTMLALLAAAAGLAACVSPTPYRAADTDGIRFGYSSTKLSDQLYRVRFIGTGRTPVRWVDAFLLYRAAEVAKQADAPAFKIVEGNIDTSVLAGEDLFGHRALDLEVAVTVSRVSRPSVRHGDVVVGQAESADGMQRTAGAMPVFRMPPPALPKYQPPVYIYTPGYAPAPLPDRTLLIELRPDLRGMDDKSFVTADVLDRLGPRIRRAAPKDQAPKPTPSTAL
ncbi:MAG: hypothetical protein REJ24_23590 [Rhodocyclaceae bacterium]|nr:hypothetical protein [Rhodocyclaceae bacterium]MDQ8003047.1 hypothetical protein [Pseudomonadota bacterium]